MHISNLEPDADLGGAFKSAMRRLAATVTILTTAVEGRRHGMAATAVTSLTTDPPSLLACVNKSASIHDPFLDSGVFCVNLLSRDHCNLVPVFSGKEKGERRFSSGEWQIGDLDIPFLADAQASIFCKIDQSMSYGSHSIFIGAVKGIRLSETVSPLLYQDGGFFRTIAITK